MCTSQYSHAYSKPTLETGLLDVLVGTRDKQTAITLQHHITTHQTTSNHSTSNHKHHTTVHHTTAHHTTTHHSTSNHSTSTHTTPYHNTSATPHHITPQHIAPFPNHITPQHIRPHYYRLRINVSNRPFCPWKVRELFVKYLSQVKKEKESQQLGRRLSSSQRMNYTIGRTLFITLNCLLGASYSCLQAS